MPSDSIRTLTVGFGISPNQPEVISGSWTLPPVGSFAPSQRFVLYYYICMITISQHDLQFVLLMKNFGNSKKGIEKNVLLEYNDVINFGSITMKRILSICVLTFFILTLFSGCQDESLSLLYQTYSVPKNLDPLLAQSESETVITGNIFEGLMALDKSGKAVYAGAENHTVSNDGRVYTFKLNKDKKWSDGSEVTAGDYVFALQRAADPQTNSPYTGAILDIHGVAAALNGTSSVQNIGVSALDDYTLTITLNAPSSNFLERLTQSVFFPCNKKFFDKTKGKYGLSEDTVLSNGYFALSSWNKEKGTVAISKAEHYSGDKQGPAYVSFVPYNDEEEEGREAPSAIKEKISITQIDTKDIEDYTSNDYSIYNSYSGVYALVFNPSSSISGADGVLKALRADIDAAAVAAKLPGYFVAANGVVPPDCDISLAANGGAQVYSYSPANARKTFLEAQKGFEDGFPDNISVLCADDERLTEILKSVLSVWQRDLGAYFNIETVADETELAERVASGSYDIALISFECASLKAETFLGEFLSNNENDVSGFKNSGYDALVGSAVSAEGESKKELIFEAERTLISQNNNFIPLFFAPQSYACIDDINPNSIRLVNGYIDLSNVQAK